MTSIITVTADAILYTLAGLWLTTVAAMVLVVVFAGYSALIKRIRR
jgi:hypothetical protein